MKKKLIKSANFTDIHFGGRSNSIQHNQDCIDYIDWFCDNVRQNEDIDHVCFLGDWFDNRSTINVATLNYSYIGMQKLNSLGIPIFFCIGNHDIYQRFNRDIHSPKLFEDFSNVRVIDHPVVIKEIGEGILLCPFLFPHEYPSLVEYKTIAYWWGHFEFKGFVITGGDFKMPTGPNPDDFKGPKFIFSGHFHKRQAYKNVVYIGNTFPTNFNDAGDHDRGMMIFDHNTDDVKFINWKECPKFMKVKLSDILEKKKRLLKNARVRCEIDVPIDYEESAYIKDFFTKKYKLREIILEESPTLRDSITETDAEIENTTLTSVNDMVLEMLSQIDNENISNEKLITLYRELEVD